MNILTAGLITLAGFIANPVAIASTQDSANTPHALSIPSGSAFSAVKVSRGDEMQVLSSTLFQDEYFVVIHCTNDACTKNEVVTVYGGSLLSGSFFSSRGCGESLTLAPCASSYFHFRQDGRFLFVLMKNRGCRLTNNRSFGLFGDCIYYGNPQILPLAGTTKQGNEVHLTYGPAHWISMRFIHTPSADAQTSRQENRSSSSVNQLAAR